jgi:hypothetical protein
VFKEGDKVKLGKVDSGHGALRYDVPVGTIGTVTFVTNDGAWMFVDWGVEEEGAMRMWPEELEQV